MVKRTEDIQADFIAENIEKILYHDSNEGTDLNYLA